MQQCTACKVWFKSVRAVKSHLQRQKDCQQYISNPKICINNVNKSMQTLDDFNDFTNITDVNDNTKDYSSDTSSIINNSNKKPRYDTQFIDNLKHHYEDGYHLRTVDEGQHKSHIHLLSILKKANTPLYLFDEIMLWARHSVLEHKVHFDTIPIQSREKVINDLQNQFLLQPIKPQCIDVTLRGSKQQVQIIVHDFKSLLRI